MPFFVLTVAIVFSLVFTIVLVPLTSITDKVDVRFLFTVLLVASTTVSSTVSLVFYSLLTKGR